MRLCVSLQAKISLVKCVLDKQNNRFTDRSVVGFVTVLCREESVGGVERGLEKMDQSFCLAITTKVGQIF